jgi:hypothetical protein
MKFLKQKTLFFICCFFILSAFSFGAFSSEDVKSTPSKRKLGNEDSASINGGDSARARTDDDGRERLRVHSPDFKGAALGNTAARVAQRKANHFESSLFTTHYKEFTKSGQKLLSIHTKKIRAYRHLIHTNL